MPWILLITAGLFEVVWAFTMKQSEGFTKVGPSVTIWTGIGAIRAFIVGIVVLGEPANMMRIIAGVLIISGLVMMKLASPA